MSRQCWPDSCQMAEKYILKKCLCYSKAPGKECSKYYTSELAQWHPQNCLWSRFVRFLLLGFFQIAYGLICIIIAHRSVLLEDQGHHHTLDTNQSLTKLWTFILRTFANKVQTWYSFGHPRLLFLSTICSSNFMMFASLKSIFLVSNKYLLVHSSHLCSSQGFPGSLSLAGVSAFSIFLPESNITICSCGHKLVVVRFLDTLTRNLVQLLPFAQMKLDVWFFIETWTRFWLLMFDGGVLIISVVCVIFPPIFFI